MDQYFEFQKLYYYIRKKMVFGLLCVKITKIWMTVRFGAK